MLIDCIDEYCRLHGLPPSPGGRVLVALSGGGDSTALLLILHQLAPRWGCTLAALHIQHALRGAESDGDERFCRQLATRLGVPFHRRLARLADPDAGNLEERLRAARRAIYHSFHRAGYDRVALGHTRDDQAETVLLHLWRGAGLDGLAGMAPRAGQLIRPLLNTPRSSLATFLAEREQPAREDSSNRDPRFLRNRIRHRLLPLVRTEIQPAAERVLARAADVVRQQADALRALLAAALRPHLHPEPGGGVSIPLEVLRRLPGPARPAALRELVTRVRGHRRGLSAAHTQAMLDFARQGPSGRRHPLPGGGWLWRSCGWLLVEPAGPVAPPPEVRLPVPGRADWPAGGLVVQAVRGGTPTDGEGVRFPWDGSTVICRTLRPGDRIGPAGSDRAVSRLLMRQGVPAFRRRTTLVFTDPDRGTVLAVSGLAVPPCYNGTGQSVVTITWARSRHESS